MKTDVSEKGLEDIIVDHLVAVNGYELGKSDDFDAKFAVDWPKLHEFLLRTQPVQAGELRLHEEGGKLKFLTRLNHEIESRGIVDVLRKGIKCYPVHLTLMYATPTEKNADAAAKFACNVFSVTRQLKHRGKETSADAIDLCLFVNGLPVITCELKNAYTNQDTSDAVDQYKTDRRPELATLFRFKRCVGHFAVDDATIMYTTKLEGEKSFFIPFNKGWNDGAGNPPNPDGLKTDYFWKETLEKRSLANILENYAQVVEKKDKKTGKVKESLIFPRYHQIQVVRRLLADVRENGVGRRYLIQHSAGSGKSNSIAWLTHQLVELEKDGANVVDSVVVVTDRVNLDKQIRDTIRQFAQQSKLVAWASASGQLKAALEDNKKIVITTVHKFKYIADDIASQATKRFAIVIDEAHSSQSGDLAAEMNITLSGDERKEGEVVEDVINRLMESRQMMKNASYFAFTATPKNKTLEMFGERRVEGGKPVFRPYDYYSMKQAIEEKFIFDVLENYIPAKSYYRVVKTVEADEKFDEKKALKRIRAFVEGQKTPIRRKAAEMVTHFISQVSWRVNKEARAMVVTRGIVSAIEYYYAIKELLEEVGSKYRPMIAFSGEKEYGGKVVTEETINGFPSAEIEETFRTGDWRILVVADKFQTGYDEPLLHTMYVDKELSDIKAVQTLSRLNRRTNPAKKDTCVIDFHDNEDAVREAFAKYYHSTKQVGDTDPNNLYDLQARLEAAEVYTNEEACEVVRLLMSGEPRPRIDAIIDACVANYQALDDEKKIAFKGGAKGFCRTYGFLAAILPMGEPMWEKLSHFFRLLVPKLPSPDDPDLAKGVLDRIDLESYRIEVKGNIHPLEDRGEGTVDPNNPGLPHGKRDPKVELLSVIVDEFNTLWGGIKWTNADNILKLIKQAPEAIAKVESFANAIKESDDQNAKLECEAAMKKLVVDSLKDSTEFYKQFKENDAFRAWLLDRMFERAKEIAAA